MEFFGKITAVMPRRSGTSARTGKPWASQEYVIEDASSRFPRRMVFTVFGDDAIARFALKEGMQCTVSFDIDAHDYNGRWFNSIQAYNVTPLAAAPGTAQPASVTAAQPPQGTAAIQQPTSFPAASDTSDSLPF